MGSGQQISVGCGTQEGRSTKEGMWKLEDALKRTYRAGAGVWRKKIREEGSGES